MMIHAAPLMIAMLLDAIFGEPKWLWRRFSHPAVLFGTLISGGDRRFNTGAHKRLKGSLFILALCLCLGVLAWVISHIPWADIILGGILLAQRSLVDHVKDVRKALDQNLPLARKSVAMIVGRDTAEMDENAVARAAIESAAENFSDGFVAPAFWFLIAGLPGIVIYKLVNTADSMIGYRTERHKDFGWAAARLDDILNLIPARLTAVLLYPWQKGLGPWVDIVKEARRHRSPNAGWPEASLARSLDIALSGPRSYHGQMTDFPWVHPDGRQSLYPQDINRAILKLWIGWLAVFGALLIVSIA